MLRFRVFEQGDPPADLKPKNAHLIGADGSALRGEVHVVDGMIEAHKRDPGPAALAIQQDVGDCGRLTVQTCLLPDHEEPYLLSLELARHRVMTLFAKLEDWQMFELPREDSIMRRVEAARESFVEALCLAREDPKRADELARQALVLGIDTSEEMALVRAKTNLSRRKAVGAMPARAIGVGAALPASIDRVRGAAAQHVDFFTLPATWRALAPSEREYRWDEMDNWVDWANRTRKPLLVGPIISFEPAALPQWVYIWEHDFEMVRDLAYEHVEQVVSRYQNRVGIWIALGGLHVNANLNFTFDQLIELTRMSVMAVKKLQPRARVLVEVSQPFGEYYCNNPRAIPPMLYVDLLIQAMVNFDGFAIKLLMGQPVAGQFTRDLMQVSNLLDQFAGYGKPLHVTIGAPSEPITSLMIASSDPTTPADPDAGVWRRPWSPLVQGRWLEAMFQILMSKPFVESASWGELVDHPDAELPLSGLIDEELKAKSSLKNLVAFRRHLAAVAPATDVPQVPPPAEPAPAPVDPG